MAQINITLSQDEVLQVLSENRDNAFKFLLERILNPYLSSPVFKNLSLQLNILVR